MTVRTIAESGLFIQPDKTAMDSAFNTELYTALNYLSSKSDQAKEQEEQKKVHEMKQKAKRR